MVSETTWSMTAGGYAFVCGTVLLLVLAPVRTILGDLLGVPSPFSLVLLAAPTAPIAAIAWWATIERGARYTYPFGVAFGLTTAVATVGFWVLVFAGVWGPALVLVGWLLIAFVLAVAVVAALPVGIAAMAARRRLPDRLSDGSHRSATS